MVLGVSKIEGLCGAGLSTGNGGQRRLILEVEFLLVSVDSDTRSHLGLHSKDE